MKHWRHYLLAVVIGVGSLVLVVGSIFNNASVHAQATTPPADQSTQPVLSPPVDQTPAPSTLPTTQATVEPVPSDSTPLLSPTTPLVVTVHEADGGVVVEWSSSQPGTYPLDHYVVQRGDNSADFTSITTTGGTVNTFTDVDGKSGQWYRVVAIDNHDPVNQSAPSLASQVPVHPMQDNTSIASNNPVSTTTTIPENQPAPGQQPAVAPATDNAPTVTPTATAPATQPSQAASSPAAPTTATPNQTTTTPVTGVTTPVVSPDITPLTPTSTGTTQASGTANNSTNTTSVNTTSTLPPISNLVDLTSSSPASSASTTATSTVAPAASGNGSSTTSTNTTSGAFTSFAVTSVGSRVTVGALLLTTGATDEMALTTSPQDHNILRAAEQTDVQLAAANSITASNLTKNEEAKLNQSVNNTSTTTVTDKSSLEQQVQKDDQRNTVQPPAQRTQLLDQFSDSSVVTLNHSVLEGQDGVVGPVLARYNYEKQSILELSARLDDQAKQNAKDHCQLQTGILYTTVLALPSSERGMAIEAIARCEAIKQL